MPSRQARAIFAGCSMGSSRRRLPVEGSRDVGPDSGLVWSSTGSSGPAMRDPCHARDRAAPSPRTGGMRGPYALAGRSEHERRPGGVERRGLIRPIEERRDPANCRRARPPRERASRSPERRSLLASRAKPPDSAGFTIHGMRHEPLTAGSAHTRKTPRKLSRHEADVQRRPSTSDLRIAGWPPARASNSPECRREPRWRRGARRRRRDVVPKRRTASAGRGERGPDSGSGAGSRVRAPCSSYRTRGSGERRRSGRHPGGVRRARAGRLTAAETPYLLHTARTCFMSV